MKLGNLFNKENLTAVAAGAAGAAATVPVKKFALDKINALSGKENIQNRQGARRRTKAPSSAGP